MFRKRRKHINLPAKLAQSAARLTLVREVASSSPTAGRLTQPSIPPRVRKMSTWQMMAIGGICAFQIGSLATPHKGMTQ